MVADEMVPTWRVHAIAVGLSAAAAARQGWHGDVPGPDLVGQVNRQMVCGLYVSNNTGHYDGRM